jgi:hypothetical protein
MSTRVNIEVVQLLALVVAVGGAGYGYYKWEQNCERERAEAQALHERQLETDREAARAAAAERAAFQKHQQDMERMRLEASEKAQKEARAEEERQRKAFEARLAADRAAEDARIKEQEERTKREQEEAEAARKRQEEAAAKARAELESKSKQDLLVEQKALAVKIRELETQKAALEGQIIAAKNKIQGAQKDRVVAAGQLDDALHPQVMLATDRAMDPATGSVGGVSANVDNRDGITKATQTNDAAIKQERDSRAAKQSNEDALAAVKRDLQIAKDRKAIVDGLIGPAPVAAKKTTTYIMNDGRHIDAISAIKADDSYVLKTSNGMVTVKVSDVKDILYPQE